MSKQKSESYMMYYVEFHRTYKNGNVIVNYLKAKPLSAEYYHHWYPFDLRARLIHERSSLYYDRSLTINEEEKELVDDVIKSFCIAQIKACSMYSKYKILIKDDNNTYDITDIVYENRKSIRSFDSDKKTVKCFAKENLIKKNLKYFMKYPNDIDRPKNTEIAFVNGYKKSLLLFDDNAYFDLRMYTDEKIYKFLIPDFIKDFIDKNEEII